MSFISRVLFASVFFGFLAIASVSVFAQGRVPLPTGDTSIQNPNLAGEVQNTVARAEAAITACNQAEFDRAMEHLGEIEEDQRDFARLYALGIRHLP